jgi:hypothetical protein
MHGEPQEEGGGGEGLTQDEVMVIQGALDMASKIAEAAMTPLTKVRAGMGRKQLACARSAQPGLAAVGTIL